mgnify:CR=1 FL=1
MADFYMHRMLIGKLQETFGSSPESTIGAQGPDYFYYVQGADKPRAQHFGNIIHKSKTKAFLVALLQSAIDHQSEAMLHYTYGFLSHHALDISIHPYIFYYTGLYQEEDPTNHAWAGLHLQFERKVDIAFMKHQLSIQPHRHKLYLKTLPLKALTQDIITVIDEAVEHTFGEKEAGTLFAKGYQTMRKVGRFLVYDPLKLKRKLIGLFESYQKPKSTYFQDLSHAQNTDDFDYLNLSQTPWHHPVTNASLDDSVLDIYEKALNLSHMFIQAAKESYQKKNTDGLAHILTNASYDTGIDCDSEQVMRHFLDYRTQLKD